MKLSTILLTLAVSLCYLMSAEAGPIQEKTVARQSGPIQTPAVGSLNDASDDDDDDDDDDDESLEDVLDDDDDDDDDDDEDDTPTGNQAPGAGSADDDDDDDDEDEDYLERFFDDILGEDDDDDDDDDISPSTGVQQAVPSQPQQSSPISSVVSLGESEQAAIGESDATLDGASAVNDVDADQVLPLENNELSDVGKDPIGADQVIANNVDNSVGTAAIVDDEDDDDDDEEESLEDALDDDDDDEDDDDDDDDDLIGDDVIEAKRARSLEDAAPVPDIYITKYNRFVDGIFERINAILTKSYDPVNVQLNPNSGSKTSNKKGNKKRKTQGKTNKAKNAQKKLSEQPQVLAATMARHLAEALNATTTKQPKKNKNKNAHPAQSKSTEPQPKATLYGLASLRRMGDVKVNPMADYTTVKSNFLLGPLILKVEKQFGKNEKRDIRLATATTHEMVGRINLRVVNGAATLHSIKVQQPKQVQVDSSDNHDRTREYVWKRSSNIAHLVSKKLTAATKSLLMN